jgi:hypothetical protein
MVATNSHGAVSQPSDIYKVVVDACKDFDNAMHEVQLKNAEYALKQPSTSYAGATSNDPMKPKSNFRRLECSKKTNGVDLTVPMKVVKEVNTRYENTLYGYFLGKRLAFPVVDYYVRNV